jgi:hypothetical protein
MAAALVDLGTVVTGIALAPSAVLSHLGSSATDLTTVLAWKILAGIAAIGILGVTLYASKTVLVLLTDCLLYEKCC